MKDIIDYIGDHGEFIISTIALCVALFSLLQQRKHDRLSVRPFAVIQLVDFDNYIKVKIKNSGVGPMTITKIETIDLNTNKAKGYPIEWFEELPFLWDNFKKPAGDWVLGISEEMILLHYSIDPLDNQDKIQRTKDISKIRGILKSFQIRVSYMDVYDRPQKIAIRNLEWFGRTIRI